MAKLIIMKGLPGSGKTTRALEILKTDGNCVRVNRDSLRAMMFGDRAWSGHQEKIVTEIERTIVKQMLTLGKNVIVDDTNLRNYWKDLDAEWLETIDLTNVLLTWCIERDGLRTGRAHVGRGVIERMALENGLVDLSTYTKIAIVDIDGTLANMKHRKHFLDTHPKDYQNFYGCVSYDTPNRAIIHAIQQLNQTGHTIIILSGRPAYVSGTPDINVGFLTDEWLNKHNVPNYHLFMRRSGDYRPDNVVKAELFSLLENKAGMKREAVKIVLDDRERVCEVWRMLGLPLVKVYNDHYVECREEPESIFPQLEKFVQLLGIPYSNEKPEDF